MNYISDFSRAYCRCFFLLFFALISLSATAQPVFSPKAVTDGRATGEIESLDPAFDALVPADAKLEIIAEGFDWSEGPAWVSAAVAGTEEGFLVFSDVPQNKAWKWSSKEGLSVYLEPSGWFGAMPRSTNPGDEPGSNGLMVSPDGKLVLCQHGLRQVAIMDAPLAKPESKFIPLATGYEGKKFNSPNDLAIHKNGDVYFTDPHFGLVGKENATTRELMFSGVYRIAKDGAVTLLTEELSRPNGIGFSPDYKTLYVANADAVRRHYMAYPVKDDGTIGEGRVFFDAMPLTKTGRFGSQDGMAIDMHGNLFATGLGGVLVISPEGRHLGTILTGQRTGNCTFGEDGSTLFIAADAYILRVRLKTKGMGFE